MTKWLDVVLNNSAFTTGWDSAELRWYFDPFEEHMDLCHDVCWLASRPSVCSVVMIVYNCLHVVCVDILLCQYIKTVQHVWRLSLFLTDSELVVHFHYTLYSIVVKDVHVIDMFSYWRQAVIDMFSYWRQAQRWQQCRVSWCVKWNASSRKPAAWWSWKPSPACRSVGKISREESLCCGIHHTEGSQPEWCISNMIYSRDIPFCSETLDTVSWYKQNSWKGLVVRWHFSVWIQWLKV